MSDRSASAGTPHAGQRSEHQSVCLMEQREPPAVRERYSGARNPGSARSSSSLKIRSIAEDLRAFASASCSPGGSARIWRDTTGRILRPRRAVASTGKPSWCWHKRNSVNRRLRGWCRIDRIAELVLALSAADAGAPHRRGRIDRKAELMLALLHADGDLAIAVAVASTGKPSWCWHAAARCSVSGATKSHRPESRVGVGTPTSQTVLRRLTRVASTG